MEKLNVISLTNFVRGGKSSTARLLAEKIGTYILNLDPKRDSEAYNAVKTVNIPEKSTISRTTNKINIDTQEGELSLSSKSNFVICDFGGRFDDRIKEFDSDIYLIPTMDDYESISETIKATKYILKYNPDAKIIHILNMAQCFDKSEKEDFRNGYTQLMKTNKLLDIPTIEMPRSKLLKKIINSGVKSQDIFSKNKALAKGGYKAIGQFTESLIELIKKEL